MLEPKRQPVRVYLIGDSTMADYSGDYNPGKDYLKTLYPLTGWGQVFQQFMSSDSLVNIKRFIAVDSVIVENKARGGSSTRSFFQEGRWRDVYQNLKPDDLVLMQFGHNDSYKINQERYVNVEGYKEYLRLFVSQSRDKDAYPVILTPVARNYPWKNGHLKNAHGKYDQAAKDVAIEMDVPLIDLNNLSMEYFSTRGKEYVTKHFFMNLLPGKFEAYPNGKDDNIHFQPAGAKAVAQLVFDTMKKLDVKE